MEWPNPTVFDARNVAPWVMKAPQEPPKPDFADNEELKKEYGIALGQGLDAFNAAMQVFKGEMPKALWASINWIRDPIVIAEKDVYLKALKRAEKPLDKEELLAEVLATARLCAEDKDRVAALKLYSEIAGYTGKLIDASTNTITNNTNNLTKIVLVKGSQEPEIIKAPDTNMKSKIPNSGLPQLKLVGGSR